MQILCPASGHKNVAGHQGKIDYTGSPARAPMRATGQEPVSWHILASGQGTHPGKLADSHIRASGQEPLSGIRAKESIRVSGQELIACQHRCLFQCHLILALAANVI